MIKYTNSIITATPFKKYLEFNRKILFINLSLSIFVSYGISSFFLIFFSIDKRILEFSAFIFVVITIISYPYFRKVLFNRIKKKSENLNSYFILAVILTSGVIALTLISFYYISLYFSIPAFDSKEYLKNYDIKSQDINKMLYPIILITGLVIFVIHLFLKLQIGAFHFFRNLYLSTRELLALIFILFLSYLVAWLLSFSLFIIFNGSGGFQAGG